jgi:hypothetical protein
MDLIAEPVAKKRANQLNLAIFILTIYLGHPAAKLVQRLVSDLSGAQLSEYRWLASCRTRTRSSRQKANEAHASIIA